MRDGLPVSERAGHGYGCRSIQTIAERRGGLLFSSPRGKKLKKVQNMAVLSKIPVIQ